MSAFLLSILRNVLVAAALAFLSFLLYRPPAQKDAEPSDNDFRPTADEGTEIRHLFGTGPVQITAVAVVDRDTEEIRR